MHNVRHSSDTQARVLRWGSGREPGIASPSAEVTMSCHTKTTVTEANGPNEADAFEVCGMSHSRLMRARTRTDYKRQTETVRHV